MIDELSVLFSILGNQNTVDLISVTIRGLYTAHELGITRESIIMSYKIYFLTSHTIPNSLITNIDDLSVNK